MGLKIKKVTNWFCARDLKKSLRWTSSGKIATQEMLAWKLKKKGLNKFTRQLTKRANLGVRESTIPPQGKERMARRGLFRVPAAIHS